MVLIPINRKGSFATLIYVGTSFLTNDPPDTILNFPTLVNCWIADNPPIIAYSSISTCPAIATPFATMTLFFIRYLLISSYKKTIPKIKDY